MVDFFSPNASHWAELIGPFRAVSVFRCQYSVFLKFSCSDVFCLAFSQQLNNLIFQSLSILVSCREGCKPDIFQPYPVRVGSLMYISYSKGWKPELIHGQGWMIIYWVDDSKKQSYYIRRKGGMYVLYIAAVCHNEQTASLLAEWELGHIP